MPEPPAGIDEYIALLADGGPREREAAAHDLFRRGCGSAEPVLKKWFGDPDFRALAPSKSGALLTVGIAVAPARFQAIRRNFGEPRLATPPPGENVLEFELGFGHGVQLDILTPREPALGGAIARFLERFGEGIQQVECAVRDVSRAAHLLQTRFGIEPLYPEPRDGADGTRVNFFLVSVADNRKVLIELVEARSAKNPREQ